MHLYDVVIVGAGAAGLMCAITAAAGGKKTLLLDHAQKPGSKILISGGGRCNFTNQGASPVQYLGENPHFCKSALSRYTPWDFMTLLARHGVTWHEKTLGQLFCDQGAGKILDVLLDECRQTGVTLTTGACIESVSFIENIDFNAGRFHVKTGTGVAQAKNLVIATGGMSIPKMGATDFAYKIARQFGLKIVQPVPALVPLTFSDSDKTMMTALAGVSADSLVSTTVKDAKGRVRTVAFRENILFTHRGLSGPAILQISSYLEPGGRISINLLPEKKDVFLWLRTMRQDHPRQKPAAILSACLASRLAEALTVGVDQPIGGMSNQQLQQLAKSLERWEIFPSGTEGFKKAEVTKGGVATSGLSSRTMEANTTEGLYFIGECVDVTGWLGGYNFQWAWASGHAAATAILDDERAPAQ